MATSNTIYTALLQAQRAIVPPTKAANNPHFKSKYAPLDAIVEAVRQPLLDAGIGLYWQHEVLEGRDYCTTVLVHPDSNTDLRVPVPVLFTAAGPQPWKSAVTYAKRIGLESAAGIAPGDDDDGDAAQAPARTRQAQAPAVSHNTALLGAAWKEAVARGVPVAKLYEYLRAWNVSRLGDVTDEDFHDVLAALKEATP